MKRIRWVIGGALLGSVICGLLFGWTQYAERTQWIGAGVGAILFLLLYKKETNTSEGNLS